MAGDLLDHEAAAVEYVFVAWRVIGLVHVGRASSTVPFCGEEPQRLKPRSQPRTKLTTIATTRKNRYTPRMQDPPSSGFGQETNRTAARGWILLAQMMRL
jgi:hypothetical protein